MGRLGLGAAALLLGGFLATPAAFASHTWTGAGEAEIYFDNGVIFNSGGRGAAVVDIDLSAGSGEVAWGGMYWTLGPAPSAYVSSFPVGSCAPRASGGLACVTADTQKTKRLDVESDGAFTYEKWMTDIGGVSMTGRLTDVSVGAR